MDREQIIADLRTWLHKSIETGGGITPQEILRLIDTLEEWYE